MGIKRIFRLIKRNPIGCVFSSVLSLSIVSVILLGLLWLPFSTYSLHIIKSLISEASGISPEIKNFKMNILNGECHFSSMTIFNSQRFDIQNFKTDSNIQTKNPKTEMLKIESMTIKISPLSLLAEKPIVEELHIKISSINAIRITPKTFNILMFISNISECFSTKNGILNKISVEIKKNKDDSVNVTYLDFSSSKDIISIEKSESFSYIKNTPEDIEKILKNISDEISKNTGMLFVSKAINTTLTK